jgi:hypothetical protein
MKTIVQTFALLTTLLTAFTACQTRCVESQCLNGGYCNNEVCHCPEGFAGTDCSEILTPVSMIIEKVEYQAVPDSNSVGLPWDVNDAADLSFELRVNTGVVYTSGVLNNPSLPAIYQLPVQYEMDDVSAVWNFDLYDDDNGSKELIETISFVPLDYATAIPNKIQIQGSNTQSAVYLLVDWDF